jgi:hypothetical protein
MMLRVATRSTADTNPMRCDAHSKDELVATSGDSADCMAERNSPPNIVLRQRRGSALLCAFRREPVRSSRQLPASVRLGSRMSPQGKSLGVTRAKKR